MKRQPQEYGATLLEVVIVAALAAILALSAGALAHYATRHAAVNQALNVRLMLAERALDEIVEAGVESTGSSNKILIDDEVLCLPSPRDEDGQFHFTANNDDGDGVVWAGATVFANVNGRLMRFDDFTPRDYDDPAKWCISNYTANESITFGDGTTIDFIDPAPGIRSKVMVHDVMNFNVVNVPPLRVTLEFRVPSRNPDLLDSTYELGVTIHGNN